MAFKFACQDLGVHCDFVAKGKTEEKVMAETSKHVKEVHGYTDEQLSDPYFREEAMKAIKKA